MIVSGAPVDALPLSPPASEAGTLAELATDLQAGKVQTLLILDSESCGRGARRSRLRGVDDPRAVPPPLGTLFR